MKQVAEKIELIEDIKIYLKIYKLYQSYLVLISDNENMGIGNVTLASPPLIEGMKSSSTSYQLFGIDKKLLSTIIAEKISFSLKAPILLLLFLKTKKNDQEIAKPLTCFLNDVLSEIIEEN